MSVTDYYDLLGVDADAGKDDIRTAYRDRLEGASQAERAKLNKAWNVLSDPVQRGRYNDFLEGSDEFGDNVDDDDAPVPARSSRGSQATRGARPARERPPPRPLPDPTVALPAGTVFAEKRARNMALLFDVSVILVIFILCQYLGAVVIRGQYPTETKRMDAITKQINAADKVQSRADDAKSKATKAKDTAAATVADKESKSAGKRSKRLQDDLTKEQAKLSGAYYALLFIVLLLSLLYVVPMTARSGQTFGKKRQRIRLIRVDGSPPGWSASIVHFGVPLAVAFLLFTVLGPLALVLGLGMVLWNLRDRNHQGVHDKLAKTLVVADV